MGMLAACNGEAAAEQSKPNAHNNPQCVPPRARCLRQSRDRVTNKIRHDVRIADACGNT